MNDRAWLLPFAAIAVLLVNATALEAKQTTTQPPELQQPQVEALVRTLIEAPSHGIDLPNVHADDIVKDLSAADPAKHRAAQRRLLNAIIAYARAQHGLRIATTKFDRLWAIRPAHYDAPAELRSALADGKLDAWLAALPPPFPEYDRLRDAYQAYRKLQADGGWRPLPRGPVLKQGMHGPSIAALRGRLAAEPGTQNTSPPPRTEPQPSAPAAFDAGLTESVKQLQTRYGLPATGVVDTPTRNMLNVTPAQRAETIAMNMERWRWLPRDRPATRLEVNIAADDLQLYTNNSPALNMKAAAGKPIADDETPILMASITSIVFNPPWNVPDDIAARELFPKQRRDHSYFEREHFHVRRPGEGTRLVQEPGSKNALGRIKFDFENAFGVYLHDTPEKAAFSSSHRAVSHGCVRLEKPTDLALALLQGGSDRLSEKIADLLSKTDTVRVPLPQPMPVELLYWTAASVDGGIAFRGDIYGWDGKLASLVHSTETGVDTFRSGHRHKAHRSVAASGRSGWRKKQR